MNRPWWRLAGPARYINRVEHNLTEGRSVILLYPETLVPSLKQAVSDRVVMNDFWSWRTLDLRELTDTEATCGPADLLCRYFNTDSPQDSEFPQSLYRIDFVSRDWSSGWMVYCGRILTPGLTSWTNTTN